MTDELTALATWLAPRLGVPEIELTNEGKPGSGFSAETTILSSPAGRFVLRKETPDPPVYPTQVPGLEVEVDIQYRIMSAIAAAADVPLAPLLGYESDPAVLGAPFFVMGFVDGVVPIESPMYTLEGFFTELEPGTRRTMVEDGVRTLAKVHAIDWRGAGLDWLVPDRVEPTTARQLSLWTAYAERELRGRDHPLLTRALEWLLANLPDEGVPTLCWGDPRMGNIIWSGHRAACVTDFEAASIAPPEVDLGWWLMFDRWAHETSGVTERAPGDLSRDEQRALYEELVGRSVGDTSWYELFAAARYAAIVVRVMNRLVDRGELPADQTIWIENPVVPCLVSLLEEVTA